MKKSLVFVLLVLFVSGTFAQKISTNVQAVRCQDNKRVIDKYASSESPVMLRDIEGIELGSSMNAYGVYLDGVNQVVYNDKVNSVVFIHRAPAGTVNPDNSGELAIDFSTDGGANWTTNTRITPGMQAADVTCRYPEVVLYAPDNDINNASFIASGPALLGYSSPSGWGKNFFIDGKINTAPATNESYLSYFESPDLSASQRGMLKVDAEGNVWSAITNYVAASDPQNYSKYNIVKGTRGSDGKYTWEKKSTITPDYYSEVADGSPYHVGHMFDILPDPTNAQILYFVSVTVLNGDEANFAKRPYIYKSEDGGATWGEPVKFPVDDEAMKTYLTEHGLLLGSDGVYRPDFQNLNIEFDSEGILHIFSDIAVGSDQWGYYIPINWEQNAEGTGLYYHNYYDITYKPSDNTWNANFIAPVMSKDGEQTFGSIKIWHQKYISATADRKKLVFLWDETFGQVDSIHKAPDIMTFEYDVESHTYSDTTTNLTGESDAASQCFFFKASPVAITATDKVNVPIVICPGVDIAGGSDEDPIEYLYLHVVPLANNEVAADDNSISVYPNPVVENLYINTDSNVELLDLTGRVLETVNNNSERVAINMTSYPAGIYIVKVYTANGIVSKKIIKK